MFLGRGRCQIRLVDPMDLQTDSKSDRDQGTYNSILSVDPTDSERLLIGGIDVWEWKQTVNNPPSGGFEKISLWFVNPSSPTYVHADNHEMKWDNNNRLYVGNDGGVGVSNNKGGTWFPANRGYNVTQFYGIAFDAAGRVMGGAQDNGTLYNDFSLSTYHEFREVNGGDGFECEISFFNSSVMFSSIYYNSISRSGDRGVNWTNFSPNLPGTYDPAGTDGSPNHPFHTELFLAEYFDPNSQDSVTFIPKKNYAAGAQLRIASMASGDTINTSAPTALYFDDTLYYDPSLTVGNVNYGINNATGETVNGYRHSYLQRILGHPTHCRSIPILVLGLCECQRWRALGYTQCSALLRNQSRLVVFG